MNMADRDHIRNPVEWGVDQLKTANLAVRRAGHSLRRPEETRYSPLPAVRRIEVADLKDVLARGLADFGAYRTDVIFICIIYPIAGLILARLAFGYDMLPLLFTPASGWALIVVGVGVGFLFAVLVLVISVVSFPMLLDRDVGLFTAVATSVHAVVENPVPMAVWGLIVAGGLLLGSLPALLRLIVVMPVLGHATWHLYRKLVPR